jgi:hypothetical protein
MKTNRIIDLSKTGYCQPGGLGAGSDQCKCRVKQSEKRFAFGGPDIASELLKEMTPSEPELSIIIPDSVNSREKLSAFLIASGYARGSAEYMTLYAKYRMNFTSECSYL